VNVFCFKRDKAKVLRAKVMVLRAKAYFKRDKAKVFRARVE
jgi:hypothetical protein